MVVLGMYLLESHFLQCHIFHLYRDQVDSAKHFV